jgi:HSP20 family protein
MARDLIRLMQALFLPGMEACQDAPWHPNTDVYRTREGWLVKFELAGVRAEDIDLQALGNRMVLRGVRRDCVPPGGCSYYRLEIAYSRFERAIELPCDLRRANITTDYRDGMLLVHVNPKDSEG